MEFISELATPGLHPSQPLENGHIWEFPKIGGTFLGVPIIRIIGFLGLYWGSLMSFSKREGPRDPMGYRGIIKGLYMGPLKGYMGFY